MAFIASKGKHLLMFWSNYTNKHIKFNKKEYIGCLEPAITDSMTSDQPDTHPTNNVTLQKMMGEHVQ